MWVEEDIKCYTPNKFFIGKNNVKILGLYKHVQVLKLKKKVRYFYTKSIKG